MYVHDRCGGHSADGIADVVVVAVVVVVVLLVVVVDDDFDACCFYVVDVLWYCLCRQ